MMFFVSLLLFFGSCRVESNGESPTFSCARKGGTSAETAAFIMMGVAGAAASLKQNLLILSKTAMFTTTGIEVEK